MEPSMSYQASGVSPDATQQRENGYTSEDEIERLCLGSSNDERPGQSSRQTSVSSRFSIDEDVNSANFHGFPAGRLGYSHHDDHSEGMALDRVRRRTWRDRRRVREADRKRWRDNEFYELDSVRSGEEAWQEFPDSSSSEVRSTFIQYPGSSSNPWPWSIISSNSRHDGSRQASLTPESAGGGTDRGHPRSDDELPYTDSGESEHDEVVEHQDSPLSSTDELEEEKQCRICFGGVDEEAELGRLISPCLCSGSIRHVHVKCINRWRGSGRNKKAYMQCTQCNFRYQLRRTLISGLASSAPILLLTTIVIFFCLTLFTGTLLHWLLHYRRFRRLIAGPFGDDAYKLGDQLPMGGGVIDEDTDPEFIDLFQDPLGSAIGVPLPGGFTYVSTSSGILELVVKSIRAFRSGEAVEVFAFLGQAFRKISSRAPQSLSQWMSRIAWLLSCFRPPQWLRGVLGPIMTRLSLGISLIGSASFVTFLVSSSLMAPFQLMNGVRLGGGGRGFRMGLGGFGRNNDRNRANGQMAASFGSAIIVLVVMVGAVRVVKQLYSLTEELSHWLLTKAEVAILEVNPRGEVLHLREDEMRPRRRNPCERAKRALFWLTLVTSIGAVAAQDKRQFSTLDDDQLDVLAKMSPAPWTSVHEGHLRHLLIPRPAGSENLTIVRDYVKSVFSDLRWSLEEDSFSSTTPIGDIPFSNLVFTADPDAPMKLVLAAHYDSKWFPDYPANQFIGATDSAAPCAMLLDLAEALTPLLEKQKGQGGTTLQIIFFDGEEAFHDWTATDSIYGSRHLAEKWSNTFLPLEHSFWKLQNRRLNPNPTMLSTIEHFVLLDLLGASKPRILSSYRETDWLHGELREADQRLREADLVATHDGDSEWFPSFHFNGWIEDDQLPFIHRGVSVLHVIANPFPRVWHTIKDDADALDLPTLQRWNLILRTFTAGYLGLEVPVHGGVRDELIMSLTMQNCFTSEYMHALD